MEIYCGEYRTHLGSECLLACFQNILKYYHHNVDESDVFILGEGLKTKYRYIPDVDSDIVIASNVNGSVIKFCSMYKIRTYKKDKIDSSSAKLDLLYFLSNKKPVTIMVDPGYLNYSPIYYNGFGLTHFLNVLQYNAIRNQVLISDGFIPTIPPCTFQDWYDLNLIESAREIKHNLYLVYDAGEFHGYETINEDIRTCLKANIIDYLSGNSDISFYCGIKALQKFSYDIPKYMDIFGSEFSEKMLKLNYNMKIQGFVTSKLLLYKTIEKMGQDSSRFIDSMITKSLREMLEEWNKICLLIVRTSLIPNKDGLLSISDRVKSLIPKEMYIYEKIISMI